MAAVLGAAVVTELAHISHWMVLRSTGGGNGVHWIGGRLLCPRIDVTYDKDALVVPIHLPGIM